MTKLVLTRKECADLIYKVASDLRFNTGMVCEPANSYETQNGLEYELAVRQSIQTLEQLLQVMDELT